MEIMKQQNGIELSWSDGGPSRFCASDLGKMSHGLSKARESLVREFSHPLHGDQRVLSLALNEAEALAWETEFPHLFFPILGEEKARERIAWQNRQNSFKKEFAFAE